MSTNEKSLFSINIIIRNSEVDAQGIVFNAHYLTYFDFTISQYLKTLGEAYRRELRYKKISFVVSNANINFLKPAKFGDEITIYLNIEKIQPATIQWKLTVVNTISEKIICEGLITWAYVSLLSRLPTRLPDVIKNLNKNN